MNKSNGHWRRQHRGHRSKQKVTLLEFDGWFAFEKRPSAPVIWATTHRLSPDFNAVVLYYLSVKWNLVGKTNISSENEWESLDRPTDRSNNEFHSFALRSQTQRTIEHLHSVETTSLRYINWSSRPTQNTHTVLFLINDRYFLMRFNSNWAQTVLCARRCLCLFSIFFLLLFISNWYDSNGFCDGGLNGKTGTDRLALN